MTIKFRTSIEKYFFNHGNNSKNEHLNEATLSFDITLNKFGFYSL